MLFVDEVSRLIAGEEAEAAFFVDPGLPVFQGHFPGEPVFPGVYLAEAAAQAAALALLAGSCYREGCPCWPASGRRAFTAGWFLGTRCAYAPP